MSSAQLMQPDKRGIVRLLNRRRQSLSSDISHENIKIGALYRVGIIRSKALLYRKPEPIVGSFASFFALEGS